jgi:hypothetical protein
MCWFIVFSGHRRCSFLTIFFTLAASSRHIILTGPSSLGTGCINLEIVLSQSFSKVELIILLFLGASIDTGTGPIWSIPFLLFRYHRSPKPERQHLGILFHGIPLAMAEIALLVSLEDNFSEKIELSISDTSKVLSILACHLYYDY